MVEILKWTPINMLGALILGITVIIGLILKHIHDNIMNK